MFFYLYCITFCRKGKYIFISKNMFHFSLWEYQYQGFYPTTQIRNAPHGDCPLYYARRIMVYFL
jgi:hypothetical protein